MRRKDAVDLAARLRAECVPSSCPDCGAEPLALCECGWQPPAAAIADRLLNAGGDAARGAIAKEAEEHLPGGSLRILVNSAAQRDGYPLGVITRGDRSVRTDDGNTWVMVGDRLFNVHPWNGGLADVGGYGIRWEVRDPVAKPEWLESSEHEAAVKLGLIPRHMIFAYGDRGVYIRIRDKRERGVFWHDGSSYVLVADPEHGPWMLDDRRVALLSINGMGEIRWDVAPSFPDKGGRAAADHFGLVPREGGSR